MNVPLRGHRRVFWNTLFRFALMLSFLPAVFLSGQIAAGDSPQYPDRYVWVFGWNLGRDSDVPEVTALLERAGKSGYTGAVVSFGLDSSANEMRPISGGWNRSNRRVPKMGWS
jgi:hypothetical protein